MKEKNNLNIINGLSKMKMANNPYKNFDTRIIRYAPGEYKQIITALEENDKEKVLDIIFKVYYRGHLQ